MTKRYSCEEDNVRWAAGARGNGSNLVCTRSGQFTSLWSLRSVDKEDS